MIRRWFHNCWIFSQREAFCALVLDLLLLSHLPAARAALHLNTLNGCFVSTTVKVNGNRSTKAQSRIVDVTMCLWGVPRQTYWNSNQAIQRALCLWNSGAIHTSLFWLSVVQWGKLNTGTVCNSAWVHLPLKVNWPCFCFVFVFIISVEKNYRSYREVGPRPCSRSLSSLWVGVKHNLNSNH